MQRSKTALVLAGGGVAGAAYEIGALCAIDQLLEQSTVNGFDCYVGTSAGGLVTACLANNISPRTMLSVLDSSLLGIAQLEERHLFALNFPDLLRRVGRVPAAIVEAARRAVRDGGQVSLLDLMGPLAAGLPSGLYDNASLEQYLRVALTTPGRSNSFGELSRELAIVATDLDSGERAVFGAPPLDEVPISLAVCASAAIPLFYRPVRINGRDYIDGGIRGTASLDVAIERGAELIVCINPMVPFDNSGHKPGRGLGDKSVQQIGSQVFRTFIHAGLHYHIKQVRRRHPEVTIILIEPTRDDLVMFDSTMRYTTRMAIARHAFKTVATHLHAHAEFYNELLAGHGVQINPARLGHDLENIAAAGENIQAVQAALVSDGALHSAPAGLAHTLAELERLVKRLEGATPLPAYPQITQIAQTSDGALLAHAGPGER